jgi:diphthamide synthase (EF-2-diphthine--ammonia ligase)
VKRDVAERIMAALARIDEAIGEIDAISAGIEDEDQRKRVRRAARDVVVDLYVSVFKEIVREYPDLDPDGAAKSG